MTRWVFGGKKPEDYIDPRAAAFKIGTFMYAAPDGVWYRCMRQSPAPKRNGWKVVPESDVPKEYRAWMLIL